MTSHRHPLLPHIARWAARRALRLVPGGHPKEISAAQAAKILEQAAPSGAVARARAELAAEFLADLRRLDAQLRGTGKKLAAAVKDSGTTLTQVFGVGPVVAGTIIGDVGDVARFPGRDHFAAYNGTAPVEVSSGNRKVYRLSLRGSRRINHAIHMAAINWIRHRHSDGRAYYEKKPDMCSAPACTISANIQTESAIRTFALRNIGHTALRPLAAVMGDCRGSAQRLGSRGSRCFRARMG